MVLKYADSILKGFATSLSMILTSVVSMIIFDFLPNYQFIIGSILVIVSIFIYL